MFSYSVGILIMMLMTSSVTSQVLSTSAKPPSPTAKPPSTTAKPPVTTSVNVTTTTSAMTTTTPLNKERGVFLTVYAGAGLNTAQLRHLPAIPYYEQFNGKVPGIKFSNHYIQFLSADIDYWLKTCYLYDYHLRSIAVGLNFNAELDVTKMGFDFMHAGVSRGTVQVAVDWLSHVVYWTDPVFQLITAAPGQPEMIEKDYYIIIHKDNLDKPEGIAVDPLAGLLFWSDNGRHAKIERSLLTGRNRTTLPLKVFSPLALEADFRAKRIFWIDEYKETIESADYDGGNRALVRKMANAWLFDLAIYKDLLIVTETLGEDVYFLNKKTGLSMASTISLSPEVSYGVVVYKEDNQPLRDKDYCKELNCDQICLTTVTGAMCTCSVGYVYNRTTSLCQQSNDLKTIVVANETEICLLDTRSFAYFKYDIDCIYTVKRHHPIIKTPQPRSRRQATDSNNVMSSTPGTNTTTKKPATATLVHSSPKPVTSTLVTKATSSAAPGFSEPKTETQLPPSSQPPIFPTAKPSSTPKPPIIITPTPQPTTAMPKPSPTTVVPTIPTTTTVPTTSPPPTAKDGDKIKHLAVNAEDRTVYYASKDNNIYMRPVDLSIDNLDVEVLTSTNGNISGLAYDWIDSDLYWSEWDTGLIKRINVEDGAMEVVPIGSNLYQPVDLVLLPHQRKLAWATKNGSASSIQTVGLDGVGLTTIISGGTFVSLTVDQHKQLLYWIDPTSPGVFSIDFDGKNGKSFLTSVDKFAHNLLFYKDYLAWAYDMNGMSYIKTFTASTAGSVAHGYLEKNFALVDMKAMDTDAQPAEQTPCRFANGGCEQICLTTHISDTPTTRCDCALGYKLADDKKGCVSELLVDNFILVTDSSHNEIFQVHLETGKTNAIRSAENQRPTSVFVDSVGQNIFWTSQNDERIYKANIYGNESTILAFLGFMLPTRLAMDETSGDVYFTSALWETLGVYSNKSGIVVSLLEPEDFYTFSAIAIFPSKGWVYYAAESDVFSPYIGRVDMDNRNETILIQSDDVVKPSGLTIDYKEEMLYWVDQYTDKVWQCDLNGENCENVYIDGMADMKDITTDGEYLYYIAWNSPFIGKLPLDGFKLEKLSENTEFGQLDTIAVYRSQMDNQQPSHTKCSDNNGLADCSHVCLPSASGHICECSMMDPLKEDGKTCSSVYQCEDSFPLVNTSMEITIDKDCSRYLNVQCPFKCPERYIAKDKYTSVNCTKTGWKEENIKDLCIEAKCPAVIPNGKLDMTCSRLIGSKCKFSCASGYAPGTDNLVCTLPMSWSDNACKEIVCSKNLKYGRFFSDCTYKPGTSCGYNCGTLYKPDPNIKLPQCQQNGTWNVDPDMLCKPVCDPSNQFECGDRSCIDKSSLCDQIYDCTDKSDETDPQCGVFCGKSVSNGAFSADCTYKPGTSCGYTCGSLYKPDPNTKLLQCQQNGTWNVDPDTVCIASKCPETYNNAVLQISCQRTVGSTCSYTCASGFSNVSPTVTCSSSLSWQPEKGCQVSCDSSKQFRCGDGSCIDKEKLCDKVNDCADKSDETNSQCQKLCPSLVENGKIALDCDRKPGSKCGVICDPPNKLNQEFTTVLCLPTGQWNLRRQPCLFEAEPSPQKSGMSKTVQVGIGLIVGVLAIVIVVLVLSFIYFRRRGCFSRDSPYTSASYTSGGNVAIENPYYMREEELPKTEQQPDPNMNDAVDPSQIYTGLPPPSDYESTEFQTVDDGITNPLYMHHNQEPIAASAEVEQREDQILTTDSWLREMSKGPDQ